MAHTLQYDWDTFKKSWRHTIDPSDEDFQHFDQIITGKIWFNHDRIKNIIYSKIGKRGRVYFNDKTANMFIYDSPFGLKLNNFLPRVSPAFLLQNIIDNLIQIMVSVNPKIKIVIVNRRDEFLEWEKEK